MRFCNWAKIFHKYRVDRTEDAAMCVKILTDAILDDVAMESLGNTSKDINPMYGKAVLTLQAIYNGSRLMIAQEDAAAMLERVDEAHFADFVNSYSYDALVQISEDVQAYGFDAYPDNVAENCANIMFQIINIRAEGKPGDVTVLTIKNLAEILNRENRLAQCNVLLSRYQYLKSQYKADIQRLSFIVEGEIEIKKMPAVSTCQFCEGKIIPRSRKTYIEASKAELTRIVSQMEGLDVTEQNVQNEKAEIEKTLIELRGQRDDIYF